MRHLWEISRNIRKGFFFWMRLEFELRALYCLKHTSSPFALVIFGDVVLMNYLVQPS
jgi:hypothetical protein